MKTYTLTDELRDYFPLPRGILTLPLSATAMLLYAVLLDRATLSRKNGWADSRDRVFVRYPVEKLAETLGLSTSAVKRSLGALERAGLLRRDRSGGGASRIFLFLPETDGSGCENAPKDGASLPPATARKCPPNNRKEQSLKNDRTYQHGEEESL